MLRRDSLDSYLREFAQKDRLGALLGGRVVSLTKEECRYEYAFNPEHCNPNGILHGGALFSVMDSSQGMFVHWVLGNEIEAAATGTATVKYHRPVTGGTIAISTTLTGREGRKLFVRSEAKDTQGNLVAEVDEIWITLQSKPNPDRN